MGDGGSVTATEVLTLPALDVAGCPAAQLPALVAQLGAWMTLAVARAASLAAAHAVPDADAALDAAGVARELGVTLGQARRLIALRAFPVERLGRRAVRVRRSDLLAYRAAQREPQRGVAPRVAVRYTRRHDEHRAATPAAQPGPHAVRARGRAGRPHDDRVPVGDGASPDPAPRRDGLALVRRAGDPVDLGPAAANAFLAYTPPAPD